MDEKNSRISKHKNKKLIEELIITCKLKGFTSEAMVKPFKEKLNFNVSAFEIEQYYKEVLNGEIIEKALNNFIKDGRVKSEVLAIANHELKYLLKMVGEFIEGEERNKIKTYTKIFQLIENQVNYLFKLTSSIVVEVIEEEEDK